MSQKTLRSGNSREQRMMVIPDINFVQVETSVKFDSYMQTKFQKIMTLDGITHEDLIESLSFENNREQVFKAGQGAGKSGSFFFFSKDRKFVIKTISKSEKDVLLGMLDDLIKHFTDTRNKSLIARIYGVCKLTTKSFTPFYLVIM